MVMEGDLTRHGEHTVQYADDILQNCTPETHKILFIYLQILFIYFQTEGKFGRETSMWVPLE